MAEWRVMDNTPAWRRPLGPVFLAELHRQQQQQQQQQQQEERDQEIRRFFASATRPHLGLREQAMIRAAQIVEQMERERARTVLGWIRWRIQPLRRGLVACWGWFVGVGRAFWGWFVGVGRAWTAGANPRARWAFIPPLPVRDIENGGLGGRSW
ncbi:hypothetical protein PV04_01013 [Phialophora macrospora]|uniref:Uncharacterized protein n=1 Tax=Phialophora macrospora TaxID=1851006 RepID=A0A0D2D5G8_9EURO|nr:hypothetical protein PV04_01013 [Phialophora macrospora]